MAEHQPDGAAPPTARRARAAVLLAAAGLALAAAVALYVVFFSSLIRHPSAPHRGDPRREYVGPLRNVDPAVAYVADERCAECHADIARSYAGHPMSRSLMPAAQAPAPPEDARHHNPFEALGAQYRVGRDGDRLWQRRA